MNTSGDAAEQVVRLSLEGVEVAAKITGSAAKEVSALLIAALLLVAVLIKVLLLVVVLLVAFLVVVIAGTITSLLT